MLFSYYKKNIVLALIILLSVCITLFFHYRYNSFNYYKITIEPINESLELKRYFNNNFSSTQFKNFLKKRGLYDREFTIKDDLDYTVTSVEQNDPQTFFIQNNMLITKIITERSTDKFVMILYQKKYKPKNFHLKIEYELNQRITRLGNNCERDKKQELVLLKALNQERRAFIYYITKFRDSYIIDDSWRKWQFSAIISIIKKEIENNEKGIITNNDRFSVVSDENYCINLDDLNISKKIGIVNRLNPYFLFIFIFSILYFFYFNLSILFKKI